jgi:hypothetical protein
VHSVLGVKTLLAVLFALPLALPGTLAAEERHPADAVLIALADLPPRDPRLYRGHIHLMERIEVGDRVFARLLLAGRVMLLAREGARLSITEVAGATTIEVQRGRVAVTVDRDNLHPEDLIEVRTPHAVVTVPSSTLVVEVADMSTFTPVGRPVEVFRLDPISGEALEPPTVAAADALVTVESPRLSSSGVVANR